MSTTAGLTNQQVLISSLYECPQHRLGNAAVSFMRALPVLWCSGI